ncbi:MAG: 16S rRNA (adenine(1518)-N(6)/adenine(1519)-N(6))-dimethyltransferase RsmA [Armatimonadetes bacterium]|jgi:16S rRNA (adenine1518-N6/adenine1519-N6)-dimethyltransferase|nr:16S rRNA (adenine(1518)-N(6)/adenine(1519)-N(6))-dimethyltransferase RsmA [Armatimonadota bacterium]
MNLTSATQIKSILARHRIHPKKRLGQNFLIDANVLGKLLDASGISAQTRVLEIGPGMGVVTRELAQRAEKVTCIEIDSDMEPVLRETLDGLPNAEVVIDDFLKVDLDKFIGERGGGSWTVVANLPYYITTPIITKLIDSKQRFRSIVLMTQKEVASRLKAAAASADYGSITVFVQYHCAVNSIARVSRNVFYPVPDVDSELIELAVRPEPAVTVEDEQLYFSIVRAAFGKRRKTLLNALSSSADLGWDRQRAESVLQAAGIDNSRRGETLSLHEFASICTAGLGLV